ncbi:MAG: hypothetical protein L6V95_05720 [Candidatus Melainabacteria bacterium]|nr:MAG: hypothetical protein L6V95_05720 [Candidatus Melainabacteria bacterium]
MNFSSSDFTPDENNIRFGLGSIKGVGQAVIEIIEKERQENGPFKSVADFASRLDSKCVNRKTLESLFKTGAFNELEPNKKKLIENIDNIINFSQSEAKSRETGQVSLLQLLHQQMTLKVLIPLQLKNFNFKKLVKIIPTALFKILKKNFWVLHYITSFKKHH